jgi:hypothetical protein
MVLTIQYPLTTSHCLTTWLYVPEYARCAG